MKLVLVIEHRGAISEVVYEASGHERFRVEEDGGVRLLKRGPLGLWWSTRAYHPPVDHWTQIRVER